MKKVIAIVMIALCFVGVGIGILFGLMVVFPKLELFGYSFVRGKYSDVKFYEVDSTRPLIINSGEFNLRLCREDGEDELNKHSVLVNFNSTLNGYTKKIGINPEGKEVKTPFLEYDANKNEINLVAPSGLVSYTFKDLIVKLPNQEGLFDVVVNSNGGEVLISNIDSDHDIPTMETFPSIMIYNNLTINKLDRLSNLKFNNDFSVGNTLKVNANGKVYFNYDEKTTKDMIFNGNIDVFGGRGSYYFPRTTVNGNVSVEKEAGNTALYFNVIGENSDFNYYASKGYVEINKFLGKMIVNSNELSMNIDEFNSRELANIQMSKGNFTLNKKSKGIFNYSVGKASVKMINFDGEIQNGVSSSGNMFISYDLKASSNKINLETESGKINVSNCDRGINIFIKGSGSVNVQALKSGLLGVNNIKALGKGSVNVNTGFKDLAVYLKTISGDLNFVAGSIHETNWNKAEQNGNFKQLKLWVNKPSSNPDEINVLKLETEKGKIDFISE